MYYFNLFVNKLITLYKSKGNFHYLVKYLFNFLVIVICLFIGIYICKMIEPKPCDPNISALDIDR